VSADSVNIVSIEKRVIDIISEQTDVDKTEITGETSFSHDLNFDSLDLIELVMGFEDEFEMTIPDVEAEKVETVGDVINYIACVQSKSKEQ
jgi:acyl carrier protein